MNMKLSASVQKPMQFLVNSSRVLNVKPFFRRKSKVVFVVGPTGTGKSRLAIDIATRIPAEVVNCDKMQVHKGLHIVTNKVTEDECRGVPHHLLGIAEPDAEFTCEDFRHHASHALRLIVARDRLPIIAGGSNSFIDALVNDDPEFRLRYETCVLWVDVNLPVLHSFVYERVDRMMKAGLINEVRNKFDPENSNYSSGIRRAIGVPELDQYLRYENLVDARARSKMLEAAIVKIKENTWTLACRQLQKLHRLHGRWSWNIHRIDATEAFVRKGVEAENAWDKLVAGPCTMIVEDFLYHDDDHVTAAVPSEAVTVMANTGFPVHLSAMAAAATR